MNVIYHTNTANLLPCVATVGIFDGVHVGHRFLIDQVIASAKVQNLQSVVITFAKHPRSILSAGFHPELLNTLEEKIAQLATTGIDTCIVLEFTEEMAALSAHDFLKSILKDQFKVSTLFVGHDHRFGHDRLEGFTEYKQYGESMGMEVIQAKRYATAEFEHICSSEIRLEIQRGNFHSVNSLLSYNYSVKGKVVNGFKIGRKIGFPTANLVPENAEKMIPPLGVYAVRLHWNNGTYNGMMNIGTRPTLSNDFKTSLEVNIFDFDHDIYNQEIEVEFIRKIRDEKKFNGLNELTEQLNKDKVAALDILSSL
ncbi:MAG: riboflavin biosynthesis protein RibF [Paludibacter sp.]|nr:riboflavin biosynthesis protein RibF [Paludibacter sp.]